MRHRLAAAALALTLLTLPVSAAGLSGMGANLFGNAFNFSKVNLQQTPVTAISVGGLAVKLQSTRLADVKKAFGGTIVHEGDGATTGATYLCYHGDGATTWFISNALGGQEFVMIVATEASKKAPAGCDAAPTNFAAPSFGIPGLGASSAEVKAALGGGGSGGKAAFRADRAGGYADIAQYIGYVFKSGKVSGVGVGETSVPTQH